MTELKKNHNEFRVPSLCEFCDDEMLQERRGHVVHSAAGMTHW